MSEMTRAEEEQAADMTLDGQIAEYGQEKDEQRMRNEAKPPDEGAVIASWVTQMMDTPTKANPYVDGPHWYDDPDETVAFARWYWDGSLNARGAAGEILDYFEKPWKFNEEYAGYKAGRLLNPLGNKHETH